MKQSKDPFEMAFDEQDDSLPESPIAPDVFEGPTTSAGAGNVNQQEEYDINVDIIPLSHPSTSRGPSVPVEANLPVGKNKEDDEDEEEENMEVELAKLPSSADPSKLAKMQTILSRFSEEQMSRYESFRRSGFQKTNMRRLLVSITGNQKISLPMTIVVCGIAKMFVGEIVETARMVMTERKESGPIRPCHIREAYRRLKLEGKVPRKSVPKLFRR